MDAGDVIVMITGLSSRILDTLKILTGLIIYVLLNSRFAFFLTDSGFIRYTDMLYYTAKGRCTQCVSEGSDSLR